MHNIGGVDGEVQAHASIGLSDDLLVELARTLANLRNPGGGDVDFDDVETNFEIVDAISSSVGGPVVINEVAAGDTASTTPTTSSFSFSEKPVATTSGPRPLTLVSR